LPDLRAFGETPLSFRRSIGAVNNVAIRPAKLEFWTDSWRWWTVVVAGLTMSCISQNPL
jgi:hypothetical protein